MSELRLIRAPVHRLHDASTDALAAWREQDALAPLVVVTPSRTVSRLLVRSCASETGAACNLLGLTLHDLAREMARASSDASELPPHGDRLLVAELLATDPGPLGVAAERPAVAAAVARSVRDLRLLDQEVPLEQIAQELHPRELETLRHVERIARGLEAALSATDLRDEAETYAAALDRPLPRGARQLLLHAIYDLGGAQRALVESIALREDVTWVVPEPDPTWSAATIVEDTIGWAVGHGFVPYAYVRDDDGGPPEPRVLAAPGLAGEAQEIARELLAAAERGRSFGDMAVLVASAEVQGPLLAAELRRAGIALTTPAPAALVDTPDGRILLSALRMLKGEAREADVAAIVGHLAEADADTPVSAARAASLARQAGCTSSDPADWPARLERLAARLEHRAAAHATQDGDGEDDPAESSIDELREDARRAEAVAVVARDGLRPLTEMRGAVESAGEGGRWRVLATKLAALVDRLGLVGPVGGAARDAAGGLSSYGELDLPLRFDHALEIWGERIGAASVRRTEPDRPPDLPRERDEEAEPPGEARLVSAGRRPGEAVLITDYNHARGLRVPLVWATGLSQDLFGGPSLPDPVLGDAVRAKVAGLTGVPLAVSSRRAEEADLLLALAAAAGEESVTLSWPRTDDATGQVRYPADPLARLIEERAASPLPADDPASAHGVVRVPRDPPAIGAADRTLLDEAEYDLAALASRDPRRAGHLDHDDRLVRGRAVHDARYAARELTAYDGMTGPDRTLGRAFSPSSLERIARCPFKAFLRDRLGLGGRRDDVSSIDPEPPDVGRLAHRVLESTLAPLVGLPPEEWPTVASLASGIRPATRRQLRRMLAEGVPGLPRVWEALAERLADALAATVGDELDALRANRRTIDALENDLAEDLALDGGTVSLRGRADRIDRDPDGSVVVTDYKYSNGKGYPDGRRRVFGAGRRLQLPAYARLAELTLPVPDAAAAPAVRFVFLREDASKTSVEARLDDDDRGARLCALVAELIDVARAGAYFQVPSEANCSSCDFAAVCGPGKERIGRMKQGDPRRQRHASLEERFP